MRCAKSSWVADENGEAVGPQPCRRPRAGLKCFRCTRLHKYCDTIPGPYEAEIVALRDQPDDDTDLISATRNWTRRVETFLRKANKEPEMQRLMRSLLHHTFELRNDFRQGYRFAPRLPPSAKIIWPIMDGTEHDDEPNETAAAANFQPNNFDPFLQQGYDQYGLDPFGLP